MSPQRLALRTLLLGRGRAVLAVLLIGASLCVLDLFAGHIASVRAEIEYQSVVGSQLGHLSVAPMASDEHNAPGAFDADQARRVRRLVEANRGVALALPHGGIDGEEMERLVVFLNDPDDIAVRRRELASALRHAGIGAVVHTWKEQSSAWIEERGASDLAFDSVAGMVFAVIASTIAATISMNALERRREVATLRALGMCSSAVFLMYVAEALWMALIGVALSLVASGSTAWIVNRLGTPDTAMRPGHTLVELDVERMLMAIVVVLAVALLAALVPAFKAARAPVAPALAGLTS